MGGFVPTYVATRDGLGFDLPGLPNVFGSNENFYNRPAIADDMKPQNLASKFGDAWAATYNETKEIERYDETPMDKRPLPKKPEVAIDQNLQMQRVGTLVAIALVAYLLVQNL